MKEKYNLHNAQLSDSKGAQGVCDFHAQKKSTIFIMHNLVIQKRHNESVIFVSWGRELKLQR
jgi:hypothetical protein